TYLDMLAAALGPYALASDFATFLQLGEYKGQPTPQLARLVGCRLTYAVESAEKHKLSLGLVKKMTGSDMITARMLHENPFDYRPQFKVLLASNHYPVIPPEDDAAWERMI